MVRELECFFEREGVFAGDFEVAEFSAHVKSLLHTAAGDGDFAIGGFCGVADLLHPVDIATELRDQDASF